ncbi:MAG: hypothetical protein QM802_24100 [Agriterribacter sp.]
MLFKNTCLCISMLILVALSCKHRNNKPAAVYSNIAGTVVKKNIPIEYPATIHVVVALCDNQYQGIVKVPAAIGNGQQPATNLYWGSTYGVKSFFSRKQSDWQLLQSQKSISDTILERLIFKHKTKDVYLMADAYDGRYIKRATENMLEYASGKRTVEATVNNKPILFGAASEVVCYTGHDGLMDFTIPTAFHKQDDKSRKAIVLACYSRRFFGAHLTYTGAAPLLWSTGLMAPEAYTLHDALAALLNNGDDKAVCNAAAKAYAKYQKCNLKAAQNLLVNGW